MPACNLTSSRAAGAAAADGWREAAGTAARMASTAKAATSITPATIPAVVRTSLNPNSPIHTDRR